MKGRFVVIFLLASAVEGVIMWSAGAHSSSWKLAGSELHLVGGYGDNWNYDGAPNVSVPLEQEVLGVEVQEEQNTGSAKASFLVPAGSTFRPNATARFAGPVTVRVRFLAFAGTQAYQDGGVTDSVVLHGDTQQGDVYAPRTPCLMAAWGPVELTVGSETVHGLDGRLEWCQQLRDPLTGKIYKDANRELPYDPASPAEGIVNNEQVAELRLVVQSQEADEANFPPFQFYMNVEARGATDFSPSAIPQRWSPPAGQERHVPEWRLEAHAPVQIGTYGETYALDGVLTQRLDGGRCFVDAFEEGGTGTLDCTFRSDDFRPSKTYAYSGAVAEFKLHVGAFEGRFAYQGSGVSPYIVVNGNSGQLDGNRPRLNAEVGLFGKGVLTLGGLVIYRDLDVVAVLAPMARDARTNALYKDATRTTIFDPDQPDQGYVANPDVKILYVDVRSERVDTGNKPPFDVAFSLEYRRVEDVSTGLAGIYVAIIVVSLLVALVGALLAVHCIRRQRMENYKPSNYYGRVPTGGESTSDFL